MIESILTVLAPVIAAIVQKITGRATTPAEVTGALSALIAEGLPELDNENEARLRDIAAGPPPVE